MEFDEKIVFLSYTKADKDRVSEIADQLAAKGLTVWMDDRRLKAGQSWDFEIRRALDRSAIIVVCISNKSVQKSGYVQREIRLALEKAEEKLVDDIYIIPVLLDDDVSIPRQLKDVQYIRYSEEDFFNKLSTTIAEQLQQIGVETQRVQDDSEISWTSYTQRERRDGIPGYEADLLMFRFSSDVFPEVYQIGDYIKSRLLDDLFFMRKELISSDITYTYGQQRFFRTHTLDVASAGPHIKGRLLSILFASHSYFAGAAHPNLFFKSFAFFIDPLFAITSLKEVFEDEDAAFKSSKQRSVGS